MRPPRPGGRDNKTKRALRGSGALRARCGRVQEMTILTALGALTGARPLTQGELARACSGEGAELPATLGIQGVPALDGIGPDLEP